MAILKIIEIRFIKPVFILFIYIITTTALSRPIYSSCLVDTMNSKTIDIKSGPVSLKIPSFWHIPNDEEQALFYNKIKSDAEKKLSSMAPLSQQSSANVTMIDCKIVTLKDKAGSMVIYSAEFSYLENFYQNYKSGLDNTMKDMLKSGILKNIIESRFAKINNKTFYKNTCIESNGTKAITLVYWNAPKGKVVSAICFIVFKPTNEIEQQINDVIKTISIQ